MVIIIVRIILQHIGKYLRQEYHRKYRRAYSSYYNSSSEDDTSCPPVDLDKPEPKSTRMFFESWNAEDVPSDVSNCRIYYTLQLILTQIGDTYSCFITFVFYVDHSPAKKCN